MKKKISIFTDGSSLGNPGPGGYGAVLLVSDGKVMEYGGAEKDTTNNRMEMMAGIIGLIEAEKLGADIVEINTDSSYLLNGITKWVFGWQKNGWITSNKEEVLNKDLWEKLLVAKNKIKGEVIWNKVKGHDGEILNERADIIAVTFAEGKQINLFNGSEIDYKEILKIEEERIKKLPKKNTKNNAKAYSYISKVDGEILIHKTWAECEKRVKGAKGAKFKKSVDKVDEEKIIEEFK